MLGPDQVRGRSVNFVVRYYRTEVESMGTGPVDRVLSEAAMQRNGRLEDCPELQDGSTSTVEYHARVSATHSKARSSFPPLSLETFHPDPEASNTLRKANG